MLEHWFNTFIESLAANNKSPDLSKFDERSSVNFGFGSYMSQLLSQGETE